MNSFILRSPHYSDLVLAHVHQPKDTHQVIPTSSQVRHHLVDRLLVVVSHSLKIDSDSEYVSAIQTQELTHPVEVQVISDPRSALIYRYKWRRNYVRPCPDRHLRLVYAFERCEQLMKSSPSYLEAISAPYVLNLADPLIEPNDTRSRSD